MATNQVFKHSKAISVVVEDPATPVAGDPVVIKQIAGVALTAEGGGGNAATETTVALDGVFRLSVKGTTGSNSAIAVGEKIYYVAADTPKLSKTSSGVLFGKALEAVGSGETATIKVLVGDK